VPRGGDLNFPMICDIRRGGESSEWRGERVIGDLREESITSACGATWCGDGKRIKSCSVEWVFQQHVHVEVKSSHVKTDTDEVGRGDADRCGG
jgi:hypothetical protein